MIQQQINTDKSNRVLSSEDFILTTLMLHAGEYILYFSRELDMSQSES